MRKKDMEVKKAKAGIRRPCNCMGLKEEIYLHHDGDQGYHVGCEICGWCTAGDDSPEPKQI